MQALREFGGAASDAEIAGRVADAMDLTQQQRTELIPSGQETKLKNRVGWTVHELKEIGVLHYPEPGRRALTPLGMEADEERISDLRAEFEAGKSSSSKQQVDDRQRTDPPTAWLIRAGRTGDRYDYNIEHGLACLGWDDVPDLRGFSSRQELRDALHLHFPDSREGTISSYTSQLWRMRTDVRLGDLVVMPRKGAPQIALGAVTREYWHDSAADMGWGRHVVSVDWKRTDVPRTALKQDLVGSLSAQMTICSITRNDASWRIQQLMEMGQDPGARGEGGDEIPDVAVLVEQFHAETGYPTEAHKEQKRLREEWAEKLAPGNIASLSRSDLRAYTNHAVNYARGEYVKHVEGEAQFIKNLDDDEYRRLLDNIRDICWGDDGLSVRIDRVVRYSGSYRKEPGTEGFSGTDVGATLAICLPDRFIPISSQRGKKWGRTAMLRRLGLPNPQRSTFGLELVDANDRLHEHLAPHFNSDTQAMGVFLHWLAELDDADDDDTAESDAKYEPDLLNLAKELLVDVEFLRDIVSLLEDKGQVILYGPPGTGKTYLARELAKELAPDESCRALVQFHPSTSYEDFFEGYRPAGTGNDGGIRYELTPGPLRRMADQAFKTPGRHVMIIDEINRGNLPRVLGELLFLLEYRNENVHPLYRPDERFSLPDNLWFIGTMNTADRSIALVDAALRRRFHFIPFFPDSGPMAGLLDRWLEQNDEPAWVGHLVDAVNSELKDVLEGSHLLLGASHFMTEYGSSPDEQNERLRRIWQYNIEPFIEDQFFGDPNQIARFQFDAVMRRHGPESRSDDAAGEEADAAETSDAPLGEDAAADNDD